MNTFQVYKKGMLELIRDYKSLLLTLMFPIVFIAIFGLAFGKGYYTYKIAVTNADQGDFGKEFVRHLRESEHSQGDKFFTVTEVPDQEGQVEQDLKGRRYDAYLYIPSDFSDVLLNNNTSVLPAEIKITGDPAFAQFFLINLSLENFITNFIKGITETQDPVIINTSYINEADENMNSEFDAMAPGLMMISIFFLLILSAMVLTQEAENRTLRRLLLSKLKSWELYAGITLSQVTLAVVMLPMVIAVSYLLGFRSNGSLIVTFGIGCLASLSAIGIGMMIAAVSRNGRDAFIIGNAVITPLFFLSGMLFPPSNLAFASVAGMDIGFLSLLPSVPAVSAANKVLFNNAGLADILPDMTLLAILTIVYWSVGVLLFERKYMRCR
ncbi:MAG: ABC transporter permease [Peptococcaceae bacterium]|nr:ABC transporter permease [Peptococcaceae bacterium]